MQKETHLRRGKPNEKRFIYLAPENWSVFLQAVESTLLHLEEKMPAASRTCSKYQLKTQILLCIQLGPHGKRESSPQVLPLPDRAGLRILERLDSPTPEV